MPDIDLGQFDHNHKSEELEFTAIHTFPLYYNSSIDNTQKERFYVQGMTQNDDYYFVCLINKSEDQATKGLNSENIILIFNKSDASGKLLSDCTLEKTVRIRFPAENNLNPSVSQTIIGCHANSATIYNNALYVCGLQKATETGYESFSGGYKIPVSTLMSAGIVSGQIYTPTDLTDFSFYVFDDRKPNYKPVEFSSFDFDPISGKWVLFHEETNSGQNQFRITHFQLDSISQQKPPQEFEHYYVTVQSERVVPSILTSQDIVCDGTSIFFFETPVEDVNSPNYHVQLAKNGRILQYDLTTNKLLNSYTCNNLLREVESGVLQDGYLTVASQMKETRSYGAIYRCPLTTGLFKPYPAYHGKTFVNDGYQQIHPYSVYVGDADGDGRDLAHPCRIWTAVERYDYFCRHRSEMAVFNDDTFHVYIEDTLNWNIEDYPAFFIGDIPIIFHGVVMSGRPKQTLNSVLAKPMLQFSNMPGVTLKNLAVVYTGDAGTPSSAQNGEESTTCNYGKQSLILVKNCQNVEIENVSCNCTDKNYCCVTVDANADVAVKDYAYTGNSHFLYAEGGARVHFERVAPTENHIPVDDTCPPDVELGRNSTLVDNLNSFTRKSFLCDTEISDVPSIYELSSNKYSGHFAHVNDLSVEKCAVMTNAFILHIGAYLVPGTSKHIDFSDYVPNHINQRMVIPVPQTAVGGTTVNVKNYIDNDGVIHLKEFDAILKYGSSNPPTSVLVDFLIICN